jgi:hypothetical protein
MTLSDQVADESCITPTAAAVFLAEHNRAPESSSVNQVTIPSTPPAMQPVSNPVMPYLIRLCIVLAIAVAFLLFMR